MKITLIVRFNGYAADTLELEPGDYSLGRDASLDININHPSIHRNHGRLFFRDNQWMYEDYGTGDVVAVTNEVPITLSSSIELATPVYISSETTGDIPGHLVRKIRSRKEKILYGAAIAMCVIAVSLLGYLLVKSQQRHSDPNVLLSQVRSKVVEFEKIKNEEAIRDYIEMGGFNEKDFRDYVGYCTGFLVAPNVVLTASHCLWGNDFLDLQTDFEVRAYDGKKYKPKRVLGFDSVRDYLYLEMDGMEAYGHLSFADDFKIGQTVYTLGNAHGQGIAIREGIMASETEDVNDPSIKYIRFSAGASPGNSGGPLLDVNGDIVALVFAATGAENYNLGTSTIDLQKGFALYVKSREPQEIKVVAKKLFSFNPHGFMHKQVLPYLNDYNDHPELVQKIQNLEFVFKTPIEFSLVSEAILGEVFDKSKALMKEIEEDLRKKNEIVLDWKSFASEKFPAIHPSQFDQSQNSFYKIKNRFYMKAGGFLDSPGKREFKAYSEQFDKENKFDFQAYGMNSELQIKNTEAIYYKPRETSKTRDSIEELAYGSLYSQMFIGTGVDDPDLVSRFLKNYLGDNGVLNSSYSPFIKPQSYKQFIIKEINKTPTVADVTDGSGREWKRFHMRLFDQMHFYVYCMNIPEGATCAARIIAVENDYRRGVVENHFRDFILAHFLENPYFWTPASIIAFAPTANGKAFSSFRGVEFTDKTTHYSLKMPYFNADFRMPKAAQTVRLQTGIHYTRENGTQWTGYGAEWVQQTSAGAELCGLGIEPTGSQSVFILNFERDLQKKLKLKEDKDLKKEDIPKLWTQTAQFKNGSAGLVYGFCAPLRENPIEIGYYFVDFKKAKPFTVSYSK